MTAVLIDANVLLDVMTQDARWLAWSADAIERAADRYRLVINAVIYAEVSVRFSRIEDMDDALPATDFVRAPVPWAAAFLAGSSAMALSASVLLFESRFRLMPFSPEVRHVQPSGEGI